MRYDILIFVFLVIIIYFYFVVTEKTGYVFCIYLNINKYQSYRYILRINNKLTTYQ